MHSLTPAACFFIGDRMHKKQWETYEEVAAFLLNRLSEHFGVERFEGKQVVSGNSGTMWEIDAKGCSDGGDRIVVVECKRHTKRGVNQAVAGSLAWTIHEVGAEGGILVSPMGLQEGAKKVAASAKIIEVVLDQSSTTTDYMLSFLNQIHVGFSETIQISDHWIVEVVPNKRGGRIA